jgi:metallo-beta-lactamase class B
MMIRHRLRVLCSIVLTTLSMVAPLSAQQPAARTAIDSFNLALANATHRMDNAATLALWADDGVSLMPSAKAIVGKPAIAEFLTNATKGLAGARMQSFDMRCHDIRIDGALASEWCVEHQVVLIPGQPRFDGWGKMALVLRRTPDGKWRLAQEAWIPSPAQPDAFATLDSVARAAECLNCAEWNQPQRPMKIFGNTYYVGTHGLSAILVTSPRGHVLIDGGLPESAPLIQANIQALGFRISDVKLILNSHAHFDHAGGIAELQRASGAAVAVLPWSARVIRAGIPAPDDPQYGSVLMYPGADSVKEVADGDTVRVGPLALAAHATGGHTPGGTTWSWRSCENSRCLNIVYADSQSPASADGFLFSHSPSYPTALSDFEHGFHVLESIPCDILLTPHPAASSFWERMAPNGPPLIDASACRGLAASAREQLARRLASEQR